VRALSSTSSLLVVSLASPNSSVVVGSSRSSFSIPAKPGASNASGVNQQTLRYYERRGLLADPTAAPVGIVSTHARRSPWYA
jgi:MerR HTH family regulatory protein